MLQNRSDALIVVVKNTVAGGNAVTITNSAGWIVGLAAGGALVGTINTIAIGGGNTVSVVNSAGWIVAVSNTSGNINITNSAGWIFAQSNTANMSAVILNSSALSITNTGFNVTNSAGWIVAVSNTNANVNITNSAGWVFAQSNTANNTVTVLNSSALVTGYDTTLIYDAATSLKMQYKVINITNSSNTVIVNAVSGLRIRVMSLLLMSQSTTNLLIQSDSSGPVNLTGPMPLAANVGFVLPFHQNGWFQTGTSTLLNMNISSATSLGGCITYLQTS